MCKYFPLAITSVALAYAISAAPVRADVEVFHFDFGIAPNDAGFMSPPGNKPLNDISMHPQTNCSFPQFDPAGGTLQQVSLEVQTGGTMSESISGGPSTAYIGSNATIQVFDPDGNQMTSADVAGQVFIFEGGELSLPVPVNTGSKSWGPESRFIGIGNWQIIAQADAAAQINCFVPGNLIFGSYTLNGVISTTLTYTYLPAGQQSQTMANQASLAPITVPEPVPAALLGFGAMLWAGGRKLSRRGTRVRQS